jgi:hypothetical protein
VAKIDYETSGVRRPRPLQGLEPLMIMMMMMINWIGYGKKWS